MPAAPSPRILRTVRQAFHSPAAPHSGQPEVVVTDPAVSLSPSSLLNNSALPGAPSDDLPLSDKLALLDQVLSEVEQETAQQLPTSAAATPLTLPLAPVLPPNNVPAGPVVPTPVVATPVAQEVVAASAASTVNPGVIPAVAPAPAAAAPSPAPTPVTSAPTSVAEALPGVIPQAVPQVVAQATDTLNPIGGRGSAKESLDASTLVIEPNDVAPAPQMLEVETTGELPVEVDGFIQHAIDHHEQLPQEIVVADDSIQVVTPQPLTKVVVLPITPEIENEGQSKNTSYSIRWLVEWSRKLMKMFTGKIIYRES